MFAIKFGVTQGSVLSPILFSVYVNDLANIDTSVNRLCMILYADDILVIAPLADPDSPIEGNPLLPSPPLLSPSPLSFPSLPLEVDPFKYSPRVWGSAVSGAPVEIELGAF